MISALHLVWIIPVSACFGFFVAALLSANGPDPDYEEDTKGPSGLLEDDDYE